MTCCATHLPKLLFSAVLFTSLAYAADDTMDVYSMSLTELLQVPITSSTLTAETLRTVPASTTVYTREEIRRMGLQNLSELVNYVPGYQGYRSDSSSLSRLVSSRGRGAVGAEILVLIDGQRLNHDWNGGAFFIDSPIALENIERVEFIRGPGSAIYGSNAMTGVINIITSAEREWLVEIGNDNLQHGSLQWHAQGSLGTLDVYASSRRSDGGALSLFDPTTNKSLNTRDPHRADDLYLQGESGDFSLAARVASRNTQQFYAVGFIEPSNTFLNTRSDSLNLGWKHALGDTVKLEAHLFNSRKIFQLRSAISANGQTFIEGGIQEQELGTQWVVQGGQKQNHWLFGWEWRNPTLTDTSAHVGTLANPYAIIPLLPQAPEDGRTINGVFAQLQLELSPTLALTTALRHDQYSDFGRHLSPRLGLVYQWDAHNTVKALYSEAFRAPTRGESGVLNSSAIEKNPNLKPETAKTTELIWMHLFDAGVISGTLFGSQVQDAILEAAVDVPPLKRMAVNGSLAVAGLELEWQQKWNSHWQSRIAMTDIFNPVGEIHTQSSVLLSGSLTYQNGAWSAALLANHQGNTVDPNEQEVPANIKTTESTYFGSRTIFGAHLSYQLRRDLDLYVHADNLLDTQYLSPANRPANYIGVPGTGRSVVVGLRGSF